MTKYKIIFEALQEKVNSSELTIEEAEILNNLAYEKYIVEDGHSKKLKARNNAKKKHIEQRFYDNMNFKYDYTDDEGTKHGTVQRSDGPEIDIEIPQKGLDAKANDSRIKISRNVTRMKGSDLTGSHEYSHSKDYEYKDVKENEFESNVRKKYGDKAYRESLRAKHDKRHIETSKKDIKDIKKERKQQYKKIEHEIYKQKPELYKDALKKFKKSNSHDRRPDEIRADIYAIQTTKGDNNSNRDRKHLNELTKRTTQQTISQINKTKDDMNKLKSEVDGTIRKKLITGCNSIIDGVVNNINKNKNNIIKKNEKINKNRQNVNDYVINKTEELRRSNKQ